jgi:hypothetical protein
MPSRIGLGNAELVSQGPSGYLNRKSTVTSPPAHELPQRHNRFNEIFKKKVCDPQLGKEKTNRQNVSGFEINKVGNLKVWTSTRTPNVSQSFFGNRLQLQIL